MTRQIKNCILKLWTHYINSRRNNNLKHKFNIKLTKKGTYTAKITFAGDKTYKASSKSIKITIK